MQITLDITREAQAELSRQAAVAGRDPEAQAAALLEEALHLPPQSALPGQSKDDTFGKRLIEGCAMIGGLTDDVDFSREHSSWRPLDLS